MPNDLFRTRLDTPLDKKALRFISSLKEDLWIAEEDIIGTEVHDIMLFEQNLIDKDEIKKILTALEETREKLLTNQLELNENFEDIHPFIEQSVINKIGIEIGGKIHTGRSRNDQISVDIRLKIRKEFNIITKGLFTLFDVLLDISKNNIDTYMPLYTHLQKGQLGVFSHYINNYLAQILRSLERLEEIYKRVNKNPLGACAIGGTSISIDRFRTAELLGFDDIVYNSIDAVSSRDYIYETLMGLSSLAIHFSRIAEDLIIWSTSEYNFVELDNAYCSVSSVMPQKKNPDTLELIRSKCSKIVSNQFNAVMIVKSIPTGYFRDFQDLKPLLSSSFELLFSIIEMLTGIFSTLIIKKENLSKAVNESFVLALDLAEILVQKYNIPFRQSHKIVALLVKNSEKPGDMLDKEKIERHIFDELKNEIKISENLIQTLGNLGFCLEKRTSQGSPAGKEVKQNIHELIKKKEVLHSLFLKRLESVRIANVSREKIIKNLLS